MWLPEAENRAKYVPAPGVSVIPVITEGVADVVDASAVAVAELFTTFTVWMWSAPSCEAGYVPGGVR